MFSHGYVYTSNPDRPGYKQNGVVRTAAQAKAAIKKILAGKAVTFCKSEKSENVRAYANGEPTAYIFFPVKLETWAVVDHGDFGSARKVVQYTGDLADCKKFVQKLYEGKNVEFTRSKDNIEVEGDGVYGFVAILKVS